MEIKRYEDMDLQALDVMREIGSIGTSHAATALFQASAERSPDLDPICEYPWIQ